MNQLVNLKRFAVTYVTVTLALVLLGLALQAGASVSLPSGLGSVLPTMMAAMREGQKRAQAGDPILTNKQAWAVARVMTVVVAVITIATEYVMVQLTPGLSQVMSMMPPMLIVGSMVFFLLVSLVLNRFFLMFGYRSHQPKQAPNSGAE